MFSYPSYFITDTIFSFSSISLKKYISTDVYLKAPVMFITACHVYNCLSRLFLILFLSFLFLSFLSISLKDYIRTHVYLNAPIMFYIYPSFLISDTIFTLFVDPLKKLYLNSHLSQTTRHVLQIAVIFYFRCDFYPPHRLVKDIIFVPTSVSKRPPCFIYTCQFLYPIQFLSFSPIS